MKLINVLIFFLSVSLVSSLYISSANNLVFDLSFYEVYSKIDVADDVEGIVYSQEQINLGNKYFEEILEKYLEHLNKKIENTELSSISSDILEILQHKKELIKLHHDSKSNLNL